MRRIFGKLYVQVPHRHLTMTGAIVTALDPRRLLREMVDAAIAAACRVTRAKN